MSEASPQLRLARIGRDDEIGSPARGGAPVASSPPEGGGDLPSRALRSRPDQRAAALAGFSRRPPGGSTGRRGPCRGHRVSGAGGGASASTGSSPRRSAAAGGGVFPFAAVASSVSQAGAADQPDCWDRDRRRGETRRPGVVLSGRDARGIHCGRVCRRPATYWAPVIILGEGWTYYAVHGGQISDFVFTALLYGGAWLVGLALREREQRIHDLVAEAAALRADTEAQAQRAVAAERRRIARELHDLVSHSVSVMAVQTQVVRLRLPGDQDQDKRELRAVETTARQALAEMRRMLGMLRDSDTRIDLAPTPGLSQLAGLLAEHEAAGGLVQHAISGHPRALPAGVDLAAERVVQEALTNSRKHSARTCP